MAEGFYLTGIADSVEKWYQMFANAYHNTTGWYIRSADDGKYYAKEGEADPVNGITQKITENGSCITDAYSKVVTLGQQEYRVEVKNHFCWGIGYGDIGSSSYEASVYINSTDALVATFADDWQLIGPEIGTGEVAAKAVVVSARAFAESCRNQTQKNVYFKSGSDWAARSFYYSILICVEK